MTRSRVDLLWHFLTTLVVDVLNPLFIISLALFVSVGYILTLLMPVDIDVWAAVLYGSIVLPLILLSARAGGLWRQKQRAMKPFSWRALLPSLPLLFLLPSFAVILLRPTLHSIAHIDIYFSYITQIYNGWTPLENVFLPGFPANYYWLYLAFIAAIVKATSLDAHSVINFANSVFIFASFYWLAQTLITLELAKPRTLYLGILVFFVFGALNLTGIISVSADIVQGTSDSRMLLSGADRRLHSVFPKVLHASGMTPSILVFAAALYFCVKMLRDRITLFRLIMISACGIVALGVMLILAPYVVVVLMGSAALTAFISWRRASDKIESAADFVRDTFLSVHPILLALWFLVSLALALPLLHYVDSLSYNLQSDITFLKLGRCRFGGFEYI